jgi:hypothetical protein
MGLRTVPRTNFRRFIEHQKFIHRPFIQGVYFDTIGVTRRNRMDEQYMQRLVDLVAWHGSPDFADRPEASPHRTEFLLYALASACFRQLVPRRVPGDGLQSGVGFRVLHEALTGRVPLEAAAEIDGDQAQVRQGIVPMTGFAVVQRSSPRLDGIQEVTLLAGLNRARYPGPGFQSIRVRAAPDRQIPPRSNRRCLPSG